MNPSKPVININELRAMSGARKELESQLQQQSARIETLEQVVSELQQALVVLLKGQRRIKHGKSGPEALEILDGEGNVFTSHQLVRDGHGRLAGSQ